MSTSMYKIFNRTELKKIESELTKRLNKIVETWVQKKITDIRVLNASEISKGIPIERIISNLRSTDETFSPKDFESLCVLLNPSDLNYLLDLRGSESEELGQCYFIEKMKKNLLKDLCEGINLTQFSKDKKLKLFTVASQPENLNRVGSGWLFIEFTISGKQLKWVVAGDLVFTPNYEVKVKIDTQLKELIGSRNLALHAELGTVDLSLGEFRSLSAGDVLILNDKMQNNIKIYCEGGDYLCNAKLGLKSGFKAIQLSGMKR